MRPLITFSVASAITVLMLSSCGDYGSGMNDMATMATASGITCGSGYSMSCPPPSVSLTAPAANSMVSGMVMLNAMATAMDGLTISSVEFLVDGTSVGTASASPYEFSWNSTTVANGSHQLTVMATDDYSGSGASATSAPITINVQNAAGGAAAMSPMQVIPAPSSNASGMADVEVQPETGHAHGSVSLKQLTATSVTINEGFAGESGPVLLRLRPKAASEGEWELPANAMLTAEQLDELRQGRLYAIASSTAHPAGEVRGQLTQPDVLVKFAALAPNEAARALGISASGVAAATVDTAARTLTVHVNSTGVEDATTAQAAGRSLAKDDVTLGHWSTEHTGLSASDLAEFKAGRWTVSVAIPEEPDAAIAGTIPAPASPPAAK
jgi:hypothetical protein